MPPTPTGSDPGHATATDPPPTTADAAVPAQPAGGGRQPGLHLRRDRFDPAAELAALRATQPVARVDVPIGRESLNAWLLTRHEDVRAVLADPELFPSGGGRRFRTMLRRQVPGSTDQTDESGLLTADPPEHTRLRRILAPEFTARRMRRLRPRVAAIVEQHLDAMAQAGPPADLVASFALPVPSLVICELLGVPFADRDEFQRRARVQLDLSAEPASRLAAFGESRAYMAELVARQRAEPGEELLGMLVREHGHDLSDQELISIGALLLIAGHETTANMLALGTALLLQRPDQLALMRDDPEITEQAVEELMRHLSVVPAPVMRTASRATTIGGTAIAEGDTVVCSLPMANRDPELVADPERLDLTRRPTAHVGFGHGIHFCLGAPLARLEMQLAFPALLRRFPELRYAVPPEDIRFKGAAVVYGPRTLPVTW